MKNRYIHELISEDEIVLKEAKQKGKHMHIFPFKALRPVNPLQAKDISALPYDVMNREEAKEMAKGLPYSYLRITRAELELPDSVDAYDPRVYAHAKENLDKFIADGVIAFDKKDCLYIYRQTMNGREQYGLVCTVPAKDYFDGIIKKHELTRKDKEDDRLRHILATNSNTGPVFLTYRDNGQFALLGEIIRRKPVYDFVTELKRSAGLLTLSLSAISRTGITGVQRVPGLRDIGRPRIRTIRVPRNTTATLRFFSPVPSSRF